MMRLRMKHVLLGIGISMFALQVQAQTASEDEAADKREMRREVPNPEKIAQKETDRLKEALELTDKQYKKVYKLLLKEQRELLENMTRRPPMMGGERGPRPPREGKMPPMGEGRPEGMHRPPMEEAPKHEGAEDMQKRIEKKNKKMKKILTESQYDQWLGMSQMPMPGPKPGDAPKQKKDDMSKVE